MNEYDVWTQNLPEKDGLYRYRRYENGDIRNLIIRTTNGWRNIVNRIGLIYDVENYKLGYWSKGIPVSEWNKIRDITCKDTEYIEQKDSDVKSEYDIWTQGYPKEPGIYRFKNYEESTLIHHIKIQCVDDYWFVEYPDGTIAELQEMMKDLYWSKGAPVEVWNKIVEWRRGYKPEKVEKPVSPQKTKELFEEVNIGDTVFVIKIPR